MKRVLSVLLSLLMLLSLAACAAPAAAVPAEEPAAPVQEPAAPVEEPAAPAPAPVVVPAESTARRDSAEINAKYLAYRYDIAFDGAEVTGAALNAALEKLGVEPVLENTAAAGAEDLLTAAIAAAEMTELYRTYSAEKAAARLDAYGAPAVEGDAALYACALDCGLLTAAEAAALAESEAVTAEDATNLLALAVELSGKGRNFLGYSDDPDITQRIYNAWSNIPRYDNPELSDLGMQILLKGITSGYTLQYDAYEAQFLPELAMRYGQDDIKHAAQLVALLNSEDMVVKLQLLPKISVYEYLLEWGPIPEPTPTYEVRPVEDRWFVYTLEYDLQMEFASREDMLRFNSIILEYAKKNDDNAETQEGLIYSSWWQPLYTTELTNDMPVGDDEYQIIAELLITNGSGYSLNPGIPATEMDRIVSETSALNENCTCTAFEVWSNAAFYRYLMGTDYQ